MPGMRGNFIQLSAFFWFLRSDLEKQILFVLHLHVKKPEILFTMVYLLILLGFILHFTFARKWRIIPVMYEILCDYMAR